MSDPGMIEGQRGIARIEAFSDGVIAIIITIMVLELKVPLAEGLEHLWQIWPVFIAYALSYVYVAIYWVNHHRLFSHARKAGNALIWANISLLFALSLIPFSTSYLGEHHFSQDAALLYLATLLLPSVTYTWLQRTIRISGDRSANAAAYHDATTRKGYAATAIYLAGFMLSFVSPWLGIACAALVATFWILPWGPLDRLFLRCDPPVGL
ncbi:MAG: TMEM175 family protein [Novosphingobium sp.]